jgi:hypothetical protein
MNRYLLIALFSFFSFTLIAQEKNNFQNYLNHYKEVQLPYEICLDSVWSIFPHNSISSEYIHKYICEPDKACDDSGDYNYTYGVRIKLEQFIVLITSKFCYDCPTEYGLGKVEYLLSVYTPEGQKKSQVIILQRSFQHFCYVTFENGPNSHSLLSILIKQGTLNESLDKEYNILQGILDYYAYTIDQKGCIRKEKTKSRNIRVKWGARQITILKEWE